MAEQDIPPVNTTCRQIIGEDPWWAVRTSLVACSFWLVLAALVAWFYYYTIPAEPEIVTDQRTGLFYRFEPREVGGGWLFITFKVNQSPICVRQSVHLIYREFPDPVTGLPKRRYVTLAPGLNGGAMPGTISDFENMFFLPIGFPSGDWTYVYRVRNGCGPLELIPHLQSLGPFTIHVP